MVGGHLVVACEPLDQMATRIHKYIHTQIHKYIHTCIRTYIHTYIHTYIQAYTHTYIHTYTRACTQSHLHTHIHPIGFEWISPSIVWVDFPQDVGLPLPSMFGSIAHRFWFIFCMGCLLGFPSIHDVFRSLFFWAPNSFGWGLPLIFGYFFLNLVDFRIILGGFFH